MSVTPPGASYRHPPSGVNAFLWKTLRASPRALPFCEGEVGHVLIQIPNISGLRALFAASTR